MTNYAGRPTQPARRQGDDLHEEEEEERRAMRTEPTIFPDDGALAQGGAQCHDRLVDNPDVGRVALVLCTGHKWRHFTLQRGTHSADKPVLTYCGKVGMRPSQPRYKPTGRGSPRPSGCCYDENVIGRREVEEVMLALLCTVRHKLVPAGTEEVQSSGAKAVLHCHSGRSSSTESGAAVSGSFSQP
jgi:hypothetical protein